MGDSTPPSTPPTLPTPPTPPTAPTEAEEEAKFTKWLGKFLVSEDAGPTNPPTDMNVASDSDVENRVAYILARRQRESAETAERDGLKKAVTDLTAKVDDLTKKATRKRAWWSPFSD